jgi:hypothetical protein
MIVGMISVTTYSCDAFIPVEMLGKAPRPGTTWVKALDGSQPFTKISHGGPFQDDTIIILQFFVRDVHLEKEPDEVMDEGIAVETIVKVPIPIPDSYVPVLGDWFLESANTVCAQRPGGREA